MPKIASAFVSEIMKLASYGSPATVAQKVAPPQTSGVRTVAARPAATAVAVPKKMPGASAVTAVRTPKPNFAGLANRIGQAVTKVAAERSAFATELEQLAKQSNPLRHLVAPTATKYDNDSATDDTDDFPSVMPTVNSLARQR